MRATEIFAQLSATLLGMGITSPDAQAALALLASRLEEIEVCTALSKMRAALMSAKTRERARCLSSGRGPRLAKEMKRCATLKACWQSLACHRQLAQR